MQRVGARKRADGVEFLVWAPAVSQLSLRIVAPREKLIPMERCDSGYFKCLLADATGETRYFFRFPNGNDRPDPASFFQPDGVHEASGVLFHDDFNWSDRDWAGILPNRLIFYELHVGSYTPEGTFEAIIPRLTDLADMGITALEIMPVSQFPGARNWGYDGVHPFAVQNSYGGPPGLKKLVDACHHHGISVILDVVYNHLGPEGNYFGEFGPYFTDRYGTPWGKAINFDGPHSDEVRNFFFQNAIYWFENFHIDGLRLDAVHSIFDFGARHFLRELSDRVREFSMKRGRRFLLIAESDLSDVRMIHPQEKGGYGLDAQWCDDFHHSLHTILTEEKSGYYEDFGRPEQFVKCLNEGFVYNWEYSLHRKRRFGSSSRDCRGSQFVVCIQNHDQIGNRLRGERLGHLLPFEALKLAGGAMFTSAFVPLLFMGEEYNEPAPFLYFVSHGDENLVKAVREGRKKEFSAFVGKTEPDDPQHPETFQKSKISWELRNEGKNKVLKDFYAALIRLRRSILALSQLEKKCLRAWFENDSKVIFLHRWAEGSQVFICMNFADGDRIVKIAPPKGIWKKRLDSSEEIWEGPGATLPDAIEADDEVNIPAFSFALYELETF